MKILHVLTANLKIPTIFANQKIFPQAMLRFLVDQVVFEKINSTNQL